MAEDSRSQVGMRNSKPKTKLDSSERTEQIDHFFIGSRVNGCDCARLCAQMHMLIVHVMRSATCMSDGHQHVRWYLHKTAVKPSTVREDPNVWVNEVTATEMFCFLSLVSAMLCVGGTYSVVTSFMSTHYHWKKTERRKQNQKWDDECGLCTRFPDTLNYLNSLMFSGWSCSTDHPLSTGRERNRHRDERVHLLWCSA